jgi:hypothetical protein
MFDGQPKTADIVVDGVLVTSVELARTGIALRPGRHQIELRAESYQSAYVEVLVTAGRPQTVPFQLVAELP